jgi:hypothetical protein
VFAIAAIILFAVAFSRTYLKINQGRAKWIFAFERGVAARCHSAQAESAACMTIDGMPTAFSLGKSFIS